LEAIENNQIVWRLLGLASALLVLSFLDKVDRSLSQTSSRRMKPSRAALARCYPGFLGILAIPVSMVILMFYIPALLAEAVAGSREPIGWVLWEDVSKRLTACVLFLLFLFRVRGVGLKTESTLRNPNAARPPFRIRHHRATVAVLAVFLAVSLGESWLQRCVRTADNAIGLAEAGDFDGAVRTAERIWPEQRRSHVSLPTVACSVCHEFSSTDGASRADARAQVLAKIAQIQAQANSDDFSSLVAAGTIVEHASSRAHALATFTRAQAHRMQ
jgi:hypothetical protein